jgi:hypothetical protein
MTKTVTEQWSPLKQWRDLAQNKMAATGWPKRENGPFATWLQEDVRETYEAA